MRVPVPEHAEAAQPAALSAPLVPVDAGRGGETVAGGLSPEAIERGTCNHLGTRDTVARPGERRIASSAIRWRSPMRRAQPLLGKALQGYYLFRRLAYSPRLNSAVALMDRHRDDFYAQAWKDAAARIEAAITPLGNNFFRIARGPRAICVNRNISTIDSSAAVLLADDKPATHHLLAAAGIPVPPHLVTAVSEQAAALDFLRSARLPVVVKPAAGTAGGNGVSTNVATAADLRRAIGWAGAFARRVLIEQQIAGETYRLLFFRGELLDCVIRRSPRLVGDGAATVSDLVHAENARRLAAGYERSQSLLGIDREMRTTLALQGLRLGTVPAKGREFVVKQVVNDNNGVENETATELLCDEIVATGRRAVGALGLGFAGIDIITRDPALPLHLVGGAVVDVNPCPGFYYHYRKKDGCLPVASHLLDGIFNHAS
jgi:D-alanine-D-alanine ligase-like ATP-grasp enzyme